MGGNLLNEEGTDILPSLPPKPHHTPVLYEVLSTGSSSFSHMFWVLTSMYIKCRIFKSEVATSFLAATYSSSFLFFVFSLFVFAPCFFSFSCRASSSFFRSLSLSVRGGVTPGNSVSCPSAYNSENVSLI